MTEKIDRNMVTLVDALNGLPGISTFSSCGGRPKPHTLAQIPEVTFCVNFEVNVLRGGWRSLELIAASINRSEPESLSLTVWENGGLCFELRGKGGANPNVLADVLRDVSHEYETVEIPVFTPVQTIAPAHG